MTTGEIDQAIREVVADIPDVTLNELVAIFSAVHGVTREDLRASKSRVVRHV